MRAPRTSVLLAALVALVLAVYSSALSAPFVWDDKIIVQEQPLAARLSPLAHLTEPFWRRTAAEQGSAAYYRPASTFSLALDRARGGGAPGPFHITNLVLHAACCALVFALARRAGAIPIAAALGAAMFGLSPRLTESVTWVSGRTDVLASLFALTAVLLHASAPERLTRRCAAAAALLLGLLAKEVALGALVGIAAFEVVRARRDGGGWRQWAVGLVPAFLATLGYGVLRAAALRVMPHDAVEPLSTTARLLMPLQALAQYALMVLDPLRPSLRIGIFGDIDGRLAALGATLAVALGYGAVRIVRRRLNPVVAAACAMAACALGLVLHVVPIRLGTLTADRFLYLPVAALAVALAPAASRLRGTPARVAIGAALVGVVVFGVATSRRNEDWQDEVRLWQETVRRSDPRDAIPWNELGNALWRVDRLSDAQGVFQLLASHTTGSARVDALANVAGILSDMGRHAEARDRFAELASLEPDRPLHLFNLGLAEARMLRFDDADARMARAIELFPEYEEARRVRGVIRDARKTWDALPASASDEPTATKARRAEVWSKLGAPSRAWPLWRAVAAAPDASAGDLTQAAAFLASRGSVDEARAALGRARTAGGPPARVAAIEAVLSQRER